MFSYMGETSPLSSDTPECVFVCSDTQISPEFVVSPYIILIFCESKQAAEGSTLCSFFFPVIQFLDPRGQRLAGNIIGLIRLLIIIITITTHSCFLFSSGDGGGEMIGESKIKQEKEKRKIHNCKACLLSKK